MHRIVTVFKRDFKQLRQNNAFLIISVLVALVTVIASVIIPVTLKNKEFIGTAAAGPILELIISLAAYFLPLFVLMTFIWTFSNLIIIKEKADGNIESLLATPISAGEIWMGKSMAIFVPGYALSIISTFMVLLVVNISVIVPSEGYFMLPATLIWLSLVINPLLFLGLLLFIVLFSLANNPDIGIAPSFLVGFGLMLGIPLGIATGTINLVSRQFTLWYLVATVIMFIIDVCLYPILSKENIVLSSKGS